MAENTRYRLLENQLQNRLQEIAETIATIHASGQNELQQKFHEEMKHHNSRLEALVGDLHC